MRRRAKTLYFPARRRGSSESQGEGPPRGWSFNRVGVIVVVMALALTGGLVVGMKSGLIGGGSLNLSAGDPSASPAPAPAKSRAPAPSQTPPGATGSIPQGLVDIRRVKTVVRNPKFGPEAATGTFTSRCGTNQNDHNNTDDFILAPGATAGAHALQDYVGNVSAAASSTNKSLAAADTTCRLA